MFMEIADLTSRDPKDVIQYLCRIASCTHALGDHEESHRLLEVVAELLAAEPEQRPTG